MKLMNKIQNQKMISNFDQLSNKKTRGNKKFKNMLDVEVENKNVDNKNKKISKNKEDRTKLDKKDGKDEIKKTEDKFKDKVENDSDNEDKNKRTIKKENMYIFLSELLNLPVNELENMDLKLLLEDLGFELDLDLKLTFEGLTLEDIDFDNLVDLLEDMGLDFLEIEDRDKFVEKMNIAMDGKDFDLGEEVSSEFRLSSFIKADLDEKKESDLDFEVEDLDGFKFEIEEVEANQEKEIEETSDDTSNKQTNGKEVEVLDEKHSKDLGPEELAEEIKEDSEVEIEVDSEVVGFDNIIRKENEVLLGTDENIVQNMEEVDQKDIIKQITSKMEFNISDENQEVRINLKPDYLGEMIMNLEITKGELVAKFTVDNYKTKEILEANMLVLQKELEEAGMEIKSFEVFVGQDSDFERDSQEGFNFFNQNKQFKKRNNRNKLNFITGDYEAATVEEDLTSRNRITDGSMDLQA